MSITKESIHSGTPRFEGANIGLFIGFKHVHLLLEEAVFAHFREAGFPASKLYREEKLRLQIRASKLRLLTPLLLDDVVLTRLRPGKPQAEGELVFDAQLTAERGGESIAAAAGKVTVALVPRAGRAKNRPIPPALAPLVRASLDASDVAQHAEERTHAATGRGTAITSAAASEPHPNAFDWTWRIPYFYCQYADDVQYSGYLRLIEEVVDVFLAARGLPIPPVLSARGLIPVVAHVELRIVGKAEMGELITTRFTVDEALKDVAYSAQVEFFAGDPGSQRLTATGRISHGYAAVDGDDAGLARLDAKTLAAIMGSRT